MHLRSFIVVLSLALLPAGVAAQQIELPTEVQEWMNDGWQRRFMGMVRLGDSLFNNGSCQRCHGENGAGGRNGPNLSDSEWVQSEGNLAGIFETIFWGVRRRDFADPNRRFQMNPTGGMNLEWDEIRSLAAYVWSLSRQTNN